MKVMDTICLIIWVVNLIFAVIDISRGEHISPVLCVCALLICILHYIEKVFE